MFTCLPGAMLAKRHTLEWRKGCDCAHVHSQITAPAPTSHTLFNPVPPEAGLIPKFRETTQNTTIQTEPGAYLSAPKNRARTPGQRFTVRAQTLNLNSSVSGTLNFGRRA